MQGSIERILAVINGEMPDRAPLFDLLRNDAAEGRIMIGSSTELNNDVPFENFLALRDIVLETTY
jgi:hypothetical protein